MESTGEVLPAVKRKEKSREKIVRLLGENQNMTTATLAEAIGISPKGVERHLVFVRSVCSTMICRATKIFVSKNFVELV